MESGFLDTNEIYDPVLKQWSVDGKLAENRTFHTATLLSNGTALVVGGVTGNRTLLTAEVLDPVTHDFTSLGNMKTGRNQQTGTLLPDGQVLLAAGSLDTVTLRSAELFDPVTNSFTYTTGPLSTPRKSHTATLLADGRVLITGGKSISGDLATAEVYDPATGLFSNTGPMNKGRALHTATLLKNGKVVIIGGVITGGNETPTAELYDPLTGLFTYTGSLTLKRKRHAAALLPDGTVLAAGGAILANGDGGGERGTKTAEIYDSVTGTFSSAADMNVSRQELQATRLTDGTVLVTGGTPEQGVTDLYHPTGRSFSGVGELTQPRERHVALLLTNPAWGPLVGHILAIGGDVTGGSIFGGAQQALDSVEIYDPATAQFTSFGTMTVARQNHTATELPDGRILIAGGVGRPFVSGTAEIVTP